MIDAFVAVTGILVLSWLCSRNWHKALERGRRPIGFVFLTIALWLGMELGGLTIGLMAGSRLGAYILGLIFAATGGYISHALVSNLKQGSYKPKPCKQPQLSTPARITVERSESSDAGSLTEWELYLNGENIGRIEDGTSITALARQRYNVLEAKEAAGALNQTFVCFVKSGRHLEVRFGGGRFENAHTADILDENPAQDAPQ